MYNTCSKTISDYSIETHLVSEIQCLVLVQFYQSQIKVNNKYVSIPFLKIRMRLVFYRYVKGKIDVSSIFFFFMHRIRLFEYSARLCRLLLLKCNILKYSMLGEKNKRSRMRYLHCTRTYVSTKHETRCHNDLECFREARTV